MQRERIWVMLFAAMLAVGMAVATLATVQSWHPETGSAMQPAASGSGDLAVTLSKDPFEVSFANHSLDLVVSIWNYSNQAVTSSLMITTSLPAEFDFQYVSVTLGTCNYQSTSNQVLCNLTVANVLTTTSVEVARITVNPWHEGGFTVTAEMDTPGFLDTNLQNNVDSSVIDIWPEQNPSFSLKPGQFSYISGADILQIDPMSLGIGYPPIVAIPAANLGLTTTDDLDGLSYGADWWSGAYLMYFSVRNGASGQTGTGVAEEGACNENGNDEFVVDMPGNNTLYYEGDGVPCNRGPAYGLGLATDEELDALVYDSPEVVDPDKDGVPDRAVYFSLAPGSPTLAAHGWSAADVLVVLSTTQGITLQRFITATDIGLVSGDDIDAFMLAEDEDGVFDPTRDVLIFSLAMGSPSLTTYGVNPGDLLTVKPDQQGVRVVRVFPAELMGLQSGDDIDALKGDAWTLQSWAPFPEPVTQPTPSGCGAVPSPTGGGIWQSLAPLPMPREGGFATLIGDRIYVGQGLSHFGDDNLLFVYDIPTDTWFRGASAPVERSELNGVCVEENGQGKVYVVGGRSLNKGAVLSDVVVYDPISNTWSTRAPMPTPRAGLGLVWVPTSNTLYAIGGRTGTIPHDGTPLNVVEAYDVNAGTWITRSPMPTPVMDIYATVYYSPTHEIFVFGGYDGVTVTNKVQVYNVLSDTWSVLTASMPTARSNAAAGICGTDIYVLGGYDGANELTANEAFDPLHRTWRSSLPLPDPRAEFMVSGISSGDTIYLIGQGIHSNPDVSHDRFSCAQLSGGVIEGLKYEDQNRNGRFDFNESVMPGWVISLTTPSGNVTTTVTDMSGRYTFNNLAPGTYTVTEELFFNVRQTQPGNAIRGYTVTITGTQVITGLDFGNTFADLMGFKFYDHDRDTRPGPEDVPLGGWPILATDAAGTVYTTATDADGNYAFFLPPGTYTVTEGLPPAWEQTWPGNNILGYTVEVTSGFMAPPLDFGNVASNTVEIRKFNDLNANRKWDSGEPPVPGVAFDLFFDTPYGPLWVTTTQTDNSGAIWLHNLLPGLYTVTEARPPTGVVQTVPGPPLYGYTFTVKAGDVITGLLFGNTTLTGGMIEGVKYKDQNRNGRYDANEPFVQSWLITLTMPSGSVTSTMTGADGRYVFRDLPPGIYTLTEHLAYDVMQTQPGNAIRGYTVTITGTQVITGLDFGNSFAAVVGEKLYGIGRGGINSQSNRPLRDWLIKATDAAGTVYTVTTDVNGKFAFFLPPGTYTITEDLPSGWVRTSQWAYVNVVVPGNNSPVTFKNVASNTVGIRAFTDLNGNGKWDSGEPPYPNERFDVFQGAQLITTISTNGIGEAWVWDLMPGLYTVTEHAVASTLTQTVPGPPLYGYTFTVKAGDVITNLLFGEAPLFDLAVTKSGPQSPVPAGGDVPYTIQVSNRGQGVARGVRITDTLSQPLFSAVGKAGCTVVNATTVTCLLGDLQPGEVQGIQFTVSPQAVGVLTNTVTVTALGVDQNPQDNTAQVTTSVFAATDMSIRKQASRTMLESGDVVTFTLLVENKGPLTATSVLVTDTLPTFLTPVTVPAGCTAGSGQVTCTLGTMAPHTTVTVLLPMQASVVQQNLQGINMAEVGAALPDPKMQNNFDVVYLALRPRVIPRPEVYAIDPNQAPNNVTTTVVITGANFQSGLSAYLVQTASSTALSVQSVSPNTIVAQVPKGMSPGVYDLMVINPDGRVGTLLGAFTVFAPSVPPQLTAVVPHQAPTGQPLLVAVTGRHFVSPVVLTLTHRTQPTRTYRLNVRAFINPDMVIAGIPGNIAVGSYDLTVQNPDGLTDTLTQAYTATLAVDDLFAYPVDFWVRPRAVRAGQPITLGLLLRRWGGLTALSNVDVAFYLGNPLAGGHHIGTATAGTIAPDGRTPISLTWSAGLPSVGRYTLFAVIDPTNAVPETHENNNIISRTLTLLPPAITDATPPRVLTFTLDGGAMSTLDRQVEISLTASDAGGSGLMFVHYKEFRFDFTTRQWVVAQDTGWLPYVPTYTQSYNWRLAPFAGIHYMQAWVMDGAGNISDRPGHAFINYLPHGSGTPAPPRSPQASVLNAVPTEAYILQDEVIIFRYRFQAGDNVLVRLTSLEGDADLYVWAPDGSAVGIRETGATVEEISFTAAQDGVYQIEVAGYTDAAYQLDVLFTQTATPAPPLEAPPPFRGRPRGKPFVDPGDQPEDDVNLPSNPNATSIYLPLVFY